MRLCLALHLPFATLPLAPPPAAAAPAPPLCSACTSGYDLPVRLAIGRTVETLGGRVTDTMTKRNTHLILPVATGGWVGGRWQNLPALLCPALVCSLRSHPALLPALPCPALTLPLLAATPGAAARPPG